MIPLRAFRLAISAFGFAGCMGVSLPALADLHRWIDDRGRIHYSNAIPDSPRESVGSEPLADVPAGSSSARSRPGRKLIPSILTPSMRPLPGSPSAIDRATADRMMNGMVGEPGAKSPAQSGLP